MKEPIILPIGSNMNLDQSGVPLSGSFRSGECPAGGIPPDLLWQGGKEDGVATILPEEGSQVEGVLWKITPECEKSLDFYEGYPHLYGKEAVLVQGTDGVKREVMAYIMNAPYKDQLAIPSDLYFMGIVEGCHQNGISSRSITDALKRTRQEVGREKPSHKKTEVSR